MQSLRLNESFSGQKLSSSPSTNFIRSTDFITIYRFHHDLQISSRSTDFITINRFQHNLLFSSRFTDFTTIYIFHHDLHISPRSTNFTTIYIFHHNLQISPRSTDFITIYRFQHDIQISTLPLFYPFFPMAWPFADWVVPLPLSQHNSPLPSEYHAPTHEHRYCSCRGNAQTRKG